MPYRSRHFYPRGASPPSRCYRSGMWKEYTNTPLERDEEDEAQLEHLRRRASALTQAEMELYEDILAREADRRDTQCAPLRREIEGYFVSPDLLPPPLPRSSLWLECFLPSNYQIKNIRTFYLACQEGRLEEVDEWVRERRDVLRSIGLRDGLDIAAMGSQVHIARYLIEEADVRINGAAVRYACRNRSLALFKLFLKHGYHPDQQVPSNCGNFGTALRHCLDNEDITRLLLENGAHPNVAPFLDGRGMMWGQQTAVPMDLKSGLSLDVAVERHSFAVVRLLLEHGANPKYSRPLGRIIRKRHQWLAAQGGMDDWRPLMEMLLSYGADINATTRSSGTALAAAVWHERWEVVEFLLDEGADGRVVNPETGEDSFAVAAKRAKVDWEVTDELKRYLDRLCGWKSKADPDSVIYFGVEQNPLVQIIVKLRKRREGASKQSDEEKTLHERN